MGDVGDKGDVEIASTARSGLSPQFFEFQIPSIIADVGRLEIQK
jgi:hypothetical protein